MLKSALHLACAAGRRWPPGGALPLRPLATVSPPHDGVAKSSPNLEWQNRLQSERNRRLPGGEGHAEVVAGILAAGASVTAAQAGGCERLAPDGAARDRLRAALASRRREFCHLAGSPFPSVLKRLLKGAGGVR